MRVGSDLASARDRQQEMIESMKPGSVVVDLAAEAGGEVSHPAVLLLAALHPVVLCNLSGSYPPRAGVAVVAVAGRSALAWQPGSPKWR